MNKKEDYIVRTSRKESSERVLDLWSKWHIRYFTLQAEYAKISEQVKEMRKELPDSKKQKLKKPLSETKIEKDLPKNNLEVLSLKTKQEVEDFMKEKNLVELQLIGDAVEWLDCSDVLNNMQALIDSWKYNIPRINEPIRTSYGSGFISRPSRCRRTCANPSDD